MPFGPTDPGGFNFRPPIDPFRVFYGLTGLTFFAFAAGFSVCLFDLSKVPQCVDYAEKMEKVLQSTGDHMIAWFVAVVKEVARRSGGFHWG